MKAISFAVLTVATAFFFSCNDNNSAVNLQYTESGKKALVVIVENKDIVGQDDLSAFELYRSTVLPIFSELFEVPESDLKDKSLNEILETNGEDFQIRLMTKAASGKYDTLIVLTDASATVATLTSTLQNLSASGYCIDMMWDMHSNGQTVCLADENANVAALSAKLHAMGIRIRALYQTCCYGKAMIPSWESADIEAVCGAQNVNVLTIFSPSYFIEEWTAGKSFEAAVQAAQEREIATLRSYNNKVPTEAFFLNDANLQNSKQIIGGKNKSLLWKNIPTKTN